MSRIIMLVPLEENVSLNTISLSMIYFFNKHIHKNKSVKSILYFSCIKKKLDNTSLLIKKYFSNIVDVVDIIDLSTVFFNSDEYFASLNKIIEKCYNKKILYDLILIKGINYKNNINYEDINYDIAQNLNAEVIFLSKLDNYSLQCIEKKEQQVKFFLKRKKYKNILGLIFNKINSPLKEIRYNFINTFMTLKKIKDVTKDVIISKALFKNNLIPIIACIPWNKKIIEINIIDIFNFLKLQSINLINKKNSIIEEIIIFDESDIGRSNKNYLNALVIVSFSRIDIFIKMFDLNFRNNEIICVILTGVTESRNDVVSCLDILIDRNCSVLFTKKNTIDILLKLQSFNFDTNVKDKTSILKIQKYISSYFCYSSIMISKNYDNKSITYSPKEFCYHLKLLSRKKNKRIILPESYDTRILKAVSICQINNIAECVLLGDPDKIYSIADTQGILISKNIEIINPAFIKKDYIARFLELRKNKGLDESSAIKQLENDTVLATLILESQKVDGLVSGAINTTSDTIRPALQIIKTNSYSALVSSIFFMLFPNEVFIYGDCAININPTAEELSEIAIQSADSLKMFGTEPRIAMLSYSTGFSGSGHQVEKVRDATSIVRRKRPDLIIDGPIQYDAAVSQTVYKIKAPYSPISGSANVFIFPDLNSGNIAYKAVQRSANVLSIGPILQGLRKPVNDLSRGASVEDIVYTIALTSIQSK